MGERRSEGTGDGLRCPQPIERESGQKPPVEQKGKSSLDLDFQYEYRPRRDRGPVRRAPRPGKRGAAGKGAAPSPVTQRTFVGNLVLNHS
ncbi:unnamed protein product [Nyctereutes procyonoides]|uniref:(raccoon dog) hypothetical protein n=1 Tax=Nyctereutes procyonoides TaxID=34880 RepID=A0A811XWY1_NYCPR|nr:unnamed protein product [Nyctereutes procyonoides]